MLSGSMIGWYADNKNSKAFYLTNSGEKILKRNLFIPDSNWNDWTDEKNIHLSRGN